VNFLKKITKTETQYLFLSFSVFLFLYPSFTWDYISIVTPIAFLLLMLSFGIETFIKKRIQFKPYLFIYVFYYLVYVNVVGIPVDPSFVTTPILISIIFLTFSYDTLYKTFRVFVNVFGFFLSLSLLFFILKFIGIYSPNFDIQVAPDGREYQSYLFNTMWLGTQYNAVYLSTGFYRFHSFLNEPGFVGTISSLIIVALKFDFSRYRILYVYLLASCLSMSLASYLTLFIGVLYFTSLKRALYFIIPFFIIATFNYDLFDRYILSRIFTDEGGFIDDNRTSLSFDAKFGQLLNSNNIFLGLGKGQHTLSTQDGGVSSWKAIVYNNGLIGLGIYLTIFMTIFFAIKRRGLNNNYYYLFLFVFLLTIYHRPNIHNIYYLLILFGGLLHKPNFKKELL